MPNGKQLTEFDREFTEAVAKLEMGLMTMCLNIQFFMDLKRFLDWIYNQLG